MKPIEKTLRDVFQTSGRNQKDKAIMEQNRRKFRELVFDKLLSSTESTTEDLLSILSKNAKFLMECDLPLYMQEILDEASKEEEEFEVSENELKEGDNHMESKRESDSLESIETNRERNAHSTIIRISDRKIVENLFHFIMNFLEILVDEAHEISYSHDQIISEIITVIKTNDAHEVDETFKKFLPYFRSDFFVHLKEHIQKAEDKGDTTVVEFLTSIMDRAFIEIDNESKKVIEPLMKIIEEEDYNKMKERFLSVTSKDKESNSSDDRVNVEQNLQQIKDLCKDLSQTLSQSLSTVEDKSILSNTNSYDESADIETFLNKIKLLEEIIMEVENEN